MTQRFLLVLAVCAVAAASVQAQLMDPFTFSMPATVTIDTGLVTSTFERAGDRGRITVRDGHFAYPDGERFKFVGTALQFRSNFPDSANAVQMAQRLRALGVNHVKFMQFDFTAWNAASILAPGTSSTLGLSETQMQRFDWLTHQLREQGIYYSFVFHSAWVPRELDGVRQPDSTGWGTRIPIFFDARVQEIHREIMRMLLAHENSFTGIAYKDDPALLSVIPVDDASLMVYWLFTQELVHNPGAESGWSTGSEHLALIDSLYYEYLKARGYNSDSEINTAWASAPSNPSNQIINGGFEDPFDEESWFLFDNDNLEAQAILQFTETEKVSGEFGGRIRVGNPPNNGASGGIYIRQALTEVKDKHRYRMSLWLKTSEEQGTRRVQVYIYNGTFPFDSYNLNRTFEVTSEWQQFNLDFTAKVSNENTAFVQIRCGLDDGDLFLDDITFSEIGYEGLRNGESLENGTIRRLPFNDQNISETRARDQGQFYFQAMESLFEGDRLFVRETIGSDVLLAPSYRTYSAAERYAARNYDFINYPAFRSQTRSYVEEAGGYDLWAMTAANFESKPFVVDGLNVWFPRPYQNQTAVVVPAYAGLHDWDGINVAYFSSNGLAAQERSDSNARYTIYDKSSMLMMLPALSNAFLRGDIDPSPKTLVIQNSQDAIDYPAFHSASIYSISSGADSRIPWFRRTVMADEIQEEESYLPQLEIPGLAGEIDPTSYNGENEQIFYDATENVFRVMTPNYMAVTGMLEGKIIAETDLIVEQVSEGTFTTVTVSSLTNNPITTSEKNLLIVNSREANEGSQFNNAENNLTIWGQGPTQMEGRTMRVTIKAPEFDSCYVTPLGPDAKPMTDKRRMVERSPTGRFSIAVTTNEDESPWYSIEFSRMTTSVDEQDTPQAQLRVAPNPVMDGSFAVHHSGSASTLEVVDLTGTIQLQVATDGERTVVPTSELAPGTYVILVDGGQRGTSRVVVY